MPRTEMCPACGGDGRVYRMTAAYETTAAGANGGTFGWTGPTHEWRTCRPCGGTGLLGGAVRDCAQAVAAERERIAVAKAVATIWRDAYMKNHASGLDGGIWAIGTHPLALVLAALDGETDPVNLGCDPEEFAAVLAIVRGEQP